MSGFDRPSPVLPARAPRRSNCAAGLALALVLTAGLAGACAKPLFNPEDDRSQYDRYDSIRANYAQQFVEDEFGRRQPNLRARLTPRD